MQKIQSSKLKRTSNASQDCAKTSGNKQNGKMRLYKRRFTKQMRML